MSYQWPDVGPSPEDYRRPSVATDGIEEYGFYVYCLFDPNHVPFYVGQGSGRRAFQHFDNPEYHSNPLIRTKINEGEPGEFVPREGCYPEIVVAGLSRDEARDEEFRLILKIGRECGGTGPLVNLQLGTGRAARAWDQARKAAVQATKQATAAEQAAKERARLDNIAQHSRERALWEALQELSAIDAVCIDLDVKRRLCKKVMFGKHIPMR